MPNHFARTKASKSKKLSVQRILTSSKDKEYRQDQMSIDTDNSVTPRSLNILPIVNSN